MGKRLEEGREGGRGESPDPLPVILRCVPAETEDGARHLVANVLELDPEAALQLVLTGSTQVPASTLTTKEALDRIRWANSLERDLIGGPLQDEALRVEASLDEIDAAFASPLGPGV